ncbi:MAG: TAT (twin-arginine translocation) pathway signal sequence [Deltaproteobacteria bacterium]|nr:TAT (twin-arginine translocation) pathway signal sequence [Deltaproteobacteria bacterium]
MDRRTFLKTAGVISASFAIVGVVEDVLSYADQVTLKDCLEMTPEEMAKNSKLIRYSWKVVMDLINNISDKTLRQKLADAWTDPRPIFFSEYTPSDLAKVSKGLRDRGFLETPQWNFPPKKNAYSTLEAPGSGYSAHHSYPGGLVVHIAENLRIALGIVKAYSEILHIRDINQDVVIASQVLHDFQKPWVFQWEEDGSLRKENRLAGTGEHHIYCIAESIKREFLPEVIVALACAHEHPGTPDGEKKVISWIQAASILTGTDPIGKSLLKKDNLGLPSPVPLECWITYLGDHDWVLTNPTALSAIDTLKEIAHSVYRLRPEGKEFNLFRNYIFSRICQTSFYSIYAKKGFEGVRRVVTEIVKPL